MSSAIICEWTDRDGIEPASTYNPDVIQHPDDSLPFATDEGEADRASAELPGSDPLVTLRVGEARGPCNPPPSARPRPQKTAAPKPVATLLANANECARFEAPLAVLRLTPSQITALLILWAYGRGAELIDYTGKKLSECSGQPVEFFDEHLAGAYARLAELGMPLFRQVQRGLFVPSTGYYRPSTCDTALFGQVLNEIESERPVHPFARVQIAANVLRARGAVLPEPEPEPDASEPKTRGDAKPRRVPTPAHALNLILRSADDIVTRAESNPEIDDVAYLAHATTALQALLDTRRQLRQQRFDGSAAGEITAAEPGESATVNSCPSPDLLLTVISAAGEITAAEHSEEASRVGDILSSAAQPQEPEASVCADPSGPCDIGVATGLGYPPPSDTLPAGFITTISEPIVQHSAPSPVDAPSKLPPPRSGSKSSELTQHGAQPSKVTLETFARYTMLPEDFLTSVGIGMWLDHAGREYLGIPHFDSDGVLLGMKQRVYLEHPNAKRFGWVEGSAGLYGAEWGFTFARERPSLIVPEGITDGLTFRYHHMPAVALSGASDFKALGAEHLRGIANVVIARDADTAGWGMAVNLSKHLMNTGFKGGIFCMTFDDVKDASDLHKQVEGDRAAFKAAFRRGYESALNMREVNYSTEPFRP